MRTRTLCWAPVIIFAIAWTARAQDVSGADGRLSDILQRMRDRSSLKRAAAYGELDAFLGEGYHPTPASDDRDAPPYRDLLNEFFRRHPEEADRVTLGLIRLLQTESAASPAAIDFPAGEDYGEYLYQVGMMVSSLKDDRAIPALVGAIAGNGIDVLQYGDKALPALYAARGSPDELVRARVFEVAARILERHKDRAAQIRMEGLVRSSIKDRSLVVRGAVAMEIACLDDRKHFVPLLEKVARTDPGSIGADYHVRSEAMRSLRIIQENGRCLGH